MTRRERKYNDVKHKIKEGDVLLFRGKSFISKMIGSSTETPYSHAAVASWVDGGANTPDGILECVEFREGSILTRGGGGRSVNLHREVIKHSGNIDVYRPDPKFFTYTFDMTIKDFILTEKEFDGKAVTDIMRRMTGLPYGWRRLWWIFKHKLWLYKLFSDRNALISDELEDIVYPVCSTSIAYAFTKTGCDLVNNRSDNWTEPGDLAKSTQLNYLATLIA